MMEVRIVDDDESNAGELLELLFRLGYTQTTSIKVLKDAEMNGSSPILFSDDESKITQTLNWSNELKLHCEVI